MAGFLVVLEQVQACAGWLAWTEGRIVYRLFLPFSFGIFFLRDFFWIFFQDSLLNPTGTPPGRRKSVIMQSRQKRVAYPKILLTKMLN